MSHSFDYVIVGAGVAGVSCLYELLYQIDHRGLRGCGDAVATVALISSSDVAQGVRTVQQHSKRVAELALASHDLTSLAAAHANLTTLQGEVLRLTPESRSLLYKPAGGANRLPSAGEHEAATVRYRQGLCLCCGAVPSRPLPPSPHVAVVRDTASIQDLAARLSQAARVVMVGNGGIALELAHALTSVQELIWVVKDSHIGHAFFDEDAADFLASQLPDCGPAAHAQKGPGDLRVARAWSLCAAKNHGPDTLGQTPYGSASGPAWLSLLQITPRPPDVNKAHGGEPSGALSPPPHITLEILTQISRLEQEHRPGRAPGAIVTLGNGKCYKDIDIVICATGVEPATHWLPASLPRADDGGLIVEHTMRCQGCTDIYGAGDCCTAVWPQQARQWFQMRLWTQARDMGVLAAQRMSGLEDELAMGFAFELFTHCTRFCGLKVVLLGLYNAQRLDGEPQGDVISYTRETRPQHGPGDDNHTPGSAENGPTYVKIVLLRGRLQGALLIGETNLEETFENLILDGIDVSHLGASILEPEHINGLDLEDYFD